MPFIVINSSNAFDPINLLEFATAAEADAQAREIVTAQPLAVVRTAQLINTYSAKVTVTAKSVPEIVADTAS
ncbi:hypothetical protein AEQ67_13300 [Pseudomonas sp. RIT-PI-q]|uniref:hypothetical protein n=1 Tax=Pseudomonas sp. RIT-PI-q TaxID=1690247 RepID=UPI0006CD419E|nr:hypothetical protein [Pseudomonas sp. RIT-PI-q]KPG98326.1 hypothetical protein AEQ67_13300 [Pseudomonas sp. RIT-PI-q]